MTTLVLASGSVQAEPVQWNSVDNLVIASESIKTTLNAGIRRIAGVEEYALVGGIAVDGVMTPVQMTYQQAADYNTAIGEVQVDIFQKTAAEYLAEQSTLAQSNFNAAVDQFINAASPFIQATYVNALAAQVQTSGDAVQGQALQSYVTSNNLLITNNVVDEYNASLDSVELAAETWATVEAVYQDPNRVQGLQDAADALSYDFLNAGDLFLDRFSEVNHSAAIVFSSGVIESSILFVDVQSNLKTVSEIIDAGTTASFYTTSPTQDTGTLCSFTNAWQIDDPNLPCYEGGA